MTRVPLVTGGTGFAGSHLIEHLLETYDTVAGWSNPSGTPPPSGDLRVVWRAVDLLDRDAVGQGIQALQPSAVYHCGGVADVAGAWMRPERALKVNVMGTEHVLDAVLRSRLDCPVLVTGSALIYEPSGERLTEDSRISPRTPYGVSKLAQEMAAERSEVARVLLARPFNHAGPRQSDRYVTSAFARQIAEAEAGLRPPVLKVGNLESRRDITDVRDTVRAYTALVEHGRPRHPYNVCSGRAYLVRDLLDVLLGMSRVPLRIDHDAGRTRPSDNPLVLGDPSRIRRETGWEPRIAIERTLGDLLEHWRAVIGVPDR